MKTAITGMGFMGWIHYLATQEVQNAELAAICSSDEKKRLGDFRSIQGNFGPPGRLEDLSTISVYASYDDLLQDDSIDVVDLCVPTAFHCDYTVKALEAGKHVLLEKPIALDADDVGRMQDAARASGRYFMVAHVLPFFPEFDYALKAVQSGQYGELRAGCFKRIISKNDSSMDERAFPGSGGPGIDLHIHDSHFISLLAGVPNAVSSSGNLVDDRYATYLSSLYHYDNGLTISTTAGAAAQDGLPFVHGFDLYLEEATICYESGRQALRVYRNDGSSEEPQLSDVDPVAAFAQELEYAFDRISGGKDAGILDATHAASALALCQLEVQAIRQKKTLPFS